LSSKDFEPTDSRRDGIRASPTPDNTHALLFCDFSLATVRYLYKEGDKKENNINEKTSMIITMCRFNFNASALFSKKKTHRLTRRLCSGGFVSWLIGWMIL
jgi:hypothetical protein